MSDENRKCYQKKSKSESECNKNVPHNKKGGKEEYPCGEKRKNRGPCCCEENEENK